VGTDSLGGEGTGASGRVALGGVDREGQRRLSVGVAVGGAGGGVADLTAGADDSLYAAKVVTDHGGSGQ